MKKFLDIIPYLCFFVIILFFNLVLSPLNFDEIWSYGFSNNIYNGLLPYKDFNMVLTPFYPFFMSLFFHLFGSSMLIFHIENAVIVTIMLYLLFSILDKKAFFVLPLFVLPFNICFPNYNVFLLFLFILLLYAEKKNWNDYMIGLLITCIFLTKQSVGFIMLFSIMYYWKDKKKMFKRLFGFGILNIIFLIYLLITQSFSSFLDLCFFGLFDFGSGNVGTISLFFFLFLLLIGIGIFHFIRKREISILYFILFGSICIPLFDLYHLLLFFFAFEVVFLNFFHTIKLDSRIVGVSFYGLFLLLSVFSTSFSSTYPNNLKHFEWRYLSMGMIQFTKDVNQYLDEHSDREAIFLSVDAYYFRIIRDEKVSYFDLLNYGNFGYHGSERLLREIKKKQDVYYFVPKKLNMNNQIDKNILNYVLKNGEKIDSVSVFDIYVLN